MAKRYNLERMPPSLLSTPTAAKAAEELRGLIGRLKRRLREQSNVGDFTPSQIAVLVRLEKNGPATASGLARAEAMRPQSMGKIIAALEAEGMIRGEPDSTDGRQTILDLTETSRAWIVEGRAARQDWLSRRIEHYLSPDEQARLLTALALIRKVVDD
ncbi:MarR family winged helix-turn-helix transcriptional regulator [Brytella acorum]|uniref:MarR family transcriptional regulator n=1 Tax=Brytella acorum TaxID=2959299 RepID=A0AA35Y4K4_9PROT|nr:MarR family transcriptional regulator [Brytella acorum]MDF3624218.1 MarR family transcriptional regulator [Brytella acorum]CAI9121208.1 MarR family transcriptional regulator [Brytella acorum]